MQKFIAKAGEAAITTATFVFVFVPIALILVIPLACYRLYEVWEWIDLHANFDGDVQVRDKSRWHNS